MNTIALVFIDILIEPGIALELEVKADTTDKREMFDNIMYLVEFYGFGIVQWSYRLLPSNYYELEPHFEGPY